MSVYTPIRKTADAGLAARGLLEGHTTEPRMTRVPALPPLCYRRVPAYLSQKASPARQATELARLDHQEARAIPRDR